MVGIDKVKGLELNYGNLFIGFDDESGKFRLFNKIGKKYYELSSDGVEVLTDSYEIDYRPQHASLLCIHKNSGYKFALANVKVKKITFHHRWGEDEEFVIGTPHYSSDGWSIFHVCNEKFEKTAIPTKKFSKMLSKYDGKDYIVLGDIVEVLDYVNKSPELTKFLEREKRIAREKELQEEKVKARDEQFESLMG